MAQAAPGDEAFHRGVEAFRQGDFEAAWQFFEQARDAGLESAALYFNLGSTFYKLGRYAEAQQAFALCARDPAWTHLARYNTGLAIWQQGDRLAAAEQFSQVWREASDAKLAALALTMLERVDPMARWMPRSQVGLSIGYDSNVVLTDLAQAVPASGQSDLYTELVATTGARLGRGSSAPRWQASLYDLRYFELKEYSTTQAALGLDVPWHRGNWTSMAGGQWRYAWLDGGAFQQIGTLKVGTEYGLSRDRTLRLDVHYDLIDALASQYRFLQGQRLEAGLSTTESIARGWMTYGVVLEHNDREDLAVGADFYSSSPDRIGIAWRGAWPLGGRWRIESSARYRQSRYADPDRHGGLAQNREDREWQVGISARYRLTSAWQLTADYFYTGNHSNFEEFTYTRHLIQAGILRPF